MADQQDPKQNPLNPPSFMHRSPTPEAQPAGLNASQADLLLKVMFEREARLAREEAAIQTARAAKEKQREKNQSQHADKDLIRQARCLHLKGGKKRLGNRKDPNLVIHTYIDAVSVIKCATCGMRWKVRDTVDFLFRDGQKIKNHTKMGWAEARAMLEESTNTPTSSEIPLQTRPIAELEGVEVAS